MKNWFLSIEGIILLWAFSGCDRNSSNHQVQDAASHPVEEVKASTEGDTLPSEQIGIPEQGQAVQPGSVETESNPNMTPRDKPVVNPYNTKGPNQSKVDSIKAEKEKKKK